MFTHTVINLTRCVTKSVLISFDIFSNVYPSIHNVFKIIQKADCAVKAIAIFSTIEDLAEA